jgi:hypothetical protein
MPILRHTRRYKPPVHMIKLTAERKSRLTSGFIRTANGDCLSTGKIMARAACLQAASSSTSMPVKYLS